MSGYQAGSAHDEKVAMNDQAARRVPDLFAEKVVSEVTTAVKGGSLPYPNLRYSGSGELRESHLEALKLVGASGVRLWGFTRLPQVGVALRLIGAGVLLSCDRTTRAEVIAEARQEGLGLAYTSVGVDDAPPEGTFVTFPVHRGGAVREVVEHQSLCPKVVDEYFHGSRLSGWCQHRCRRCHLVG